MSLIFKHGHTTLLICANWITAWRYLSPAPAIERDLQAILEGRNKNDVVLMICLHDDDDAEPVGWIGLDGIHWQHGAASLAIGIGSAENRGKGYGSEAIRLLLDFAFNEMNLHHIGLTVFSYNTGARALYERLGFVYEGTRREFMQRDGERWDMHFYSMLRPEWVAKYGAR
jgi:RimJ/RimL family protein N-acetyltransferase